MQLNTEIIPLIFVLVHLQFRSSWLRVANSAMSKTLIPEKSGRKGREWGWDSWGRAARPLLNWRSGAELQKIRILEYFGYPEIMPECSLRGASPDSVTVVVMSENRKVAVLT